MKAPIVFKIEVAALCFMLTIAITAHVLIAALPVQSQSSISSLLAAASPDQDILYEASTEVVTGTEVTGTSTDNLDADDGAYYEVDAASGGGGGGTWENLTPWSADLGVGEKNGHRIEAMGDYVYAWIAYGGAVGGTTGASDATFYRYDTVGLSWSSDWNATYTETAPFGSSYGIGIVRAKDPSGNPAIYIIGGTVTNGSDKFARWTEAGGWSALLGTPSGQDVWAGSAAQLKPRNGSEFAWDGNDIIYYFPGSGYAYEQYDWYKYTISTDTWSYMGEMPALQGPGNAAYVATVGVDNYIFVYLGEVSDPYTNATFYKYGPLPSGTWTALATHAYGADDGADLVWDEADTLYHSPGAWQETVLTSAEESYFFEYSISGNTWTQLADQPNDAGSGNGSDDGGASAKVDNYIYRLKGGDGNGGTYNKDFFRYSLGVGLTYSVDIRHDSAPITGFQTDVDNVYVQINFKSSANATYYFQIYDFTNLTWLTLSSGTVGTTEVTWENTLTTNPADYISANDNIRVRLYTSGEASAHRSQEDYLVYVVNYVVPAPPGKPVLVSPENATQTDNTPTFVWIVGSGADNHRLLVDNESDFSSPADNVLLGSTDDTWTKPAPGYPDDNYYWKVIAINAQGENESDTWTFEVIAAAPPVQDILYEASTTVVTGTEVAGTSTDNLDDDDGAYYEVDAAGGGGANDVITNGSFVSDLSSWTSVITTGYLEWDAAGYVNGGCAKYYTDVGRNKDVNAYLEQSIGTISSTDTVTLSLVWKKEYDSPTPSRAQLLEVIIVKPDLTTATIWSESTVYQSSGWVVVSDEDVSTYFDQNGTYSIRLRGYVDGANDAAGAARLFYDEVVLNVTSAVTYSLEIQHDSEPITGSQVDVDSIQITLNFKSSATATYYLDIYNFSTPGWESLQSGSVGTTEVTWENAITINPADYISANDNIRVRLYTSDEASAHRSQEDYLVYVVSYVAPAPPGKPVLVSPGNATQTDNTPTFEWVVGSGADNHRLLVDNESDFSSPADDVLLGATDNTWTKPAPGYPDDNYYWKVIAINAQGENESDTWIFEAIAAPPLVQENLYEASTTVVTGTEVSGTSTDNLDADDGAYYEVDAAGGAGGTEDAEPASFGGVGDEYEDTRASGSLSDMFANDGTYCEYDKNDDLSIETWDTTGLSGTITDVVLWVNYDVESGYTGTNSFEWKLDSDATWNSTTITPADGQTDYTDSYVILSGGSWTISDLASLDLHFLNNDGKGPDWVRVDWCILRATTAGGYSLEIRHDSEPITGSQVDVENIQITLNFKSSATATYYLDIYNFSTPGWESLQSGSVGTTEVTWINTITINPADYISASDNIRVRLYTSDEASAHRSQEDYLLYVVNYTGA